MKRMFNRVTLMMLVVLPFMLTAQNREIKFEEGRWAEIVVKARNSKKIIFLDAYAAWCGPCKTMAKTVFVQDTVADFFNANFVCAKIDMEKDEGPGLAKKYGVRAYPTYLFIDGDGNLVHRSCGSMSAANFIAAGRDALDPKKQLAGLQKRFDAGERSPEFLLIYMEAISKGCMDTEPILKQYLASVAEKDLATPINWQMINRFVNDPESREFNYLLKNPAAFAKLTTMDSVNNKIYNTFLRPAYKAAYADTDEPWAVMKKKIQESRFGRAEELVFTIDLIRFEKKPDWTAYMQSAMNLTDKYKLNDYTFLINVSQRFLQHASTPEQFRKAIGWAKKATEMDPKPYSRDTYARLLEKSGDKKAAIQVLESLIQDLKAKNEPAESYENQLKLWKSE